MEEIRCIKCGALLMKGKIIKIEIKCRKCKHIQIKSAKSAETGGNK